MPRYIDIWLYYVDTFKIGAVASGAGTSCTFGQLELAPNATAALLLLRIWGSGLSDKQILVSMSGMRINHVHSRHFFTERHQNLARDIFAGPCARVQNAAGRETVTNSNFRILTPGFTYGSSACFF